MFQKYSSIENSYRRRFINDIIATGNGGGRFHCSTKIHGANFSFIITKEDIQCAKSTGLIGDGESFFNYRKVYGKLVDQLKNIQEWLGQSLNHSSVTIFGELFGGVYPHKDVPNINDVSGIQSGVYYSNDQEFLAFDVMLDGQYIPQVAMEDLCEFWQVPRVPTLFIGNLDECLAHSNQFQDPIHKLYGLPEIEGNFCEGVVIKPYDDVRFMGDSRVIIKNKNEHFSEIKGVKVHKEKPTESEQDLEMKETVARYVTDNRLKNVISKIGEVGQKDFGMLQMAMIADVRKEFFKDFDKAEYGPLFEKYVGTLCANLIRPNFQNIVDGMY